MNAEAALIYAITTYLSADGDLMDAAPGGVWYNRAGDESALPYAVWEWHHDVRTLTFGTVAATQVWFRFKAAYGDQNGANFANGNAIVERAHYLLDGVATADATRIKAALNAILVPLGWKITLCRQKPSGGYIPPHEAPIGEDRSAATARWMMGHLYEAAIQASA